jgi:hypothetical protein
MQRVVLLVSVALVVAAMMVIMAMSAFAKPSQQSSFQAKDNFCERTYTDNNGQQKKCFREEF